MQKSKIWVRDTFAILTVFILSSSIIVSWADCQNVPVNLYSQNKNEWGLQAKNYGMRINDINDIWWCGSAHKVGKNRPLPLSNQKSAYVTISLARNEYEAIQVVVKPGKNLKNVVVECSDLISSNDTISSSDVKIDKVEYVRIAYPSDSSGTEGEWPDPLPSLDKPIDIEANLNQPFWITVFAPKNINPGVYKGSLVFSGNNWKRQISLQVSVWDFTLSDQRHLKTAMGLNFNSLSQYHNVKGEDLDSVISLYYENFSEHRLSPYDPFYGSKINVNWGLDNEKTLGQVTPKQVKVDFTDFDKAMDRTINKYHFNSFRLPILAVGSGAYAGTLYLPGSIGPYTQGTEEYNLLFGSYLKQLQNHIEEKGWLDKAYLYWYDEPKYLVFEDIKEMGLLIKRYAPKLKWMLTVEFNRKLAGAVDIWCPVLYNFHSDSARLAQSAGYKVWWYICTVPKAPYVGEFIDHAAIEPRLWLWQTWKNNVQGILIWNTNYWTTKSMYGDSLQNPWKDTESWWNGSIGKKWGNGDGRFLYPQNLNPNTNKKRIIAGPVNSIRWELLRDGIEDYEYLWILQSQVNKFIIIDAIDGLNQVQKGWIEKAKRLLQVPDIISSDLTHFSKDPKYLMSQRYKIAEAIVSGNKLLKEIN